MKALDCSFAWVIVFFSSLPSAAELYSLIENDQSTKTWSFSSIAMPPAEGPGSLAISSREP
jgi:hypothetical protein